MKTLLLGLTLMLSFNTFALDITPVRGNSALAIYDVLTNRLNVEEDRRGHSPESGCYDMKIHRLLGMECHSANCTNPRTYDREFIIGCYFDRVNSVQDFTTIKTILKASGLDGRNAIFNR